MLALTPDATLLSGNTGPKRPVALTPAQSENSTSDTSPHMLLATIQSAPLTPNNRADMPPTAGELDRMDSIASLSRAPKPIASANVLGLSMSNSSYAPNYDTSKAPFVRNPVGSSVDPKYDQVKKEEKEKSGRPNSDSHSELPSVSSTDGETHSKTGAEPPLQGSTSNQLHHAMWYSDDYRIPASRIEKRNRGNTSYKKSKKQQDIPTSSKPRWQDIHSWSKDDKLSSVLNKDDPRKRPDTRSWSQDQESSNVFNKGRPYTMLSQSIWRSKSQCS